jgi:hypothetical protein
MERLFPEHLYQTLDSLPSIYPWIDSWAFAYGVS